MKLKTLFKSIMAVITAAMLNLALTSCPGPEPEPEPSLVGTWKYSWGNGNYYRLTFNGTNESGTVKVETSWDGRMNTSTYNYTYRNSVLSLGSYKDIDVIRLTSDVLVLTDFPFEEECTYTRESNNSVPSLVGTWKYTFEDGYDLLKFFRDGTGIYSQYERGEWDDEPQPFTYTYSANVIHFIFKYDGELTVRVKSLTSTNLVLEGWDHGHVTAIFIKQ